jgi:phenylalanyl-tRNA synthetase beta chain
MKVSELWLNDWVNAKITGQALADRLTMAGLEVDSIHPTAGDFSKVVVSRVLATQTHPDAAKLTLCEIDAGAGKIYKVVCGAANVRKNLVVALALPGAHLPGDITITETVLRGQPSQGMLCSTSELGLEESSEGIMELPDDSPIGKDLREFLSLDDQIFEIDLTPNRADCFSIKGIAREISALTKTPLINLEINPNFTEIDNNLSVKVTEKKVCPNYCGREIRNINSDASTPLWLKERLRRGGIRSVHPVVDVTNYVMLELGQPMHAFDSALIQGSINVRLALKDEQIQLLDLQTVNLDENTLVIADAQGPLAIAGVMGGDFSAVKKDTSCIFIESAFFTPKYIAGVARKYGLCTDSSQRFERGVDPELQIIALERVTTLLKQIVGGQVGPVIQRETKEYLPIANRIRFDFNKVSQLTGVSLSKKEIADHLHALNMKVEEQENCWLVTPPTYRFDINLDVDLVEEVIRLHGYNHIESQSLQIDMTPGTINAIDTISTEVANFLQSRGYIEAVSYSFVDPALQNEIYPDENCLTLVNPISHELSQMRVGLWPGLIAAMIYNAHRQQNTFKLFETGVIFKSGAQGTQEEPHLAAIMLGEKGELHWCETKRKFDFYDLKGDIEALFNTMHVKNVEFIPAEHAALHPGQTARILINGEEAGWVGVLHPRLQDALDIPQEVILFDIKLLSLLGDQTRMYSSISKYPLIRRDLSFIIDQSVSSSTIEKTIKENINHAWLKGLHIFDVYTGENIPKNKKSIGVALILQSEDKTLLDTEINPIIDAIITKLEQNFAITLRD